VTPRWDRPRSAGPRGDRRPEERVAVGRDRVVDAARAASIVVVIVWHWALSVTHRTPGGDWVMPNPIDTVPGAWLLTWVGQVVPVFFLAGGYANLAAWSAGRRDGVSAGRFVAGRMRRLLVPVAAWLIVWAVVEVVRRSLDPGEVIWRRFPGLVVPLWFLAVYVLLTALVPVSAALQQRHGAAVLGVLAGVIAVGSLLDRALAVPGAAWIVAAAVWVWCHQLGHAWRTTDLGHRRLRVRAAVALTGLAGLAGLTGLAGYPRSMVAELGAPSNMLPTSAAIAALAVFQLGLIALAAPALDRLLRRAWAWAPIAALNLVAVSVLAWHMTAYLIAATAYEAWGGVLLTAPTAQWWAQRWLWVVAPGVVLGGLLMLAVPVEFAARTGRSPVRGRTPASAGSRSRRRPP
jgi:fucose 4-O-acetylase-like acetyltransferase